MSSECEKRYKDIVLTDGLYLCDCGNVSTSCKKTITDGVMKVVTEDDVQQSLSFSDPSIFNDIGDLDKFGVKEYKKVLTNKFRIIVDGASVISLKMIKDDETKKNV